jgi:transposase
MKVAIWAEIHRLREVERLSARAIARRLHVSRRTVKKALASPTPPRPIVLSRPSIVDPYKPAIQRLIEVYPDLSAVRVLEEIRKDGYPGEITLVRAFLREIRPARGRVYQEVHYPAGDALQIDWGSCGVVRVGESRRKVSVFVAVLCYSRLIYIEFTLSQKKAHFYRCFNNALAFFGGATDRVILDNLSTAVAEGTGRDARFHPEFSAFCGYHRLQPVCCEKNDPESKGVVEDGVRYVKHNALTGRDEELTTFADYQKLAVYWRDQIANVRRHETLRERPIERFETERGRLRPLPPVPYDTDEVVDAIVTPYARVRFETNRYSVPPELVRKHVVLRVDDAHLRVLHRGCEVARHRRHYEKHQIVVDPDHHEAAVQMRRRKRAKALEVQFDAVGPAAEAFRRGLLTRPVKPIVHLRRVLEMVRLFGRTDVLHALGRAVELGTFDAAYVRNLVDQARRRHGLPSPTPLCPKRKELVEDVHLDEPALEDYDTLID